MSKGTLQNAEIKRSHGPTPQIVSGLQVSRKLANLQGRSTDWRPRNINTLLETLAPISFICSNPAQSCLFCVAELAVAQPYMLNHAGI